jgi:peptidoglycan/LPS O-acetylase OafA/YrhL
MSSPATPATTNYFNRLDAIRGLAILWVLVFHISGASWGWDAAKWHAAVADWPQWLAIPGQLAARLLSMGGLGVPIFFVLSGFLIHYTYSRSSDSRISTFWWRRWWRICPPYLAALIAFALWGGFFWHARGRQDFFYHLLLIHNFNDRTFFSINGSFWSLAHEWQFYALYPLLLVVRRKIGIRTVLSLALFARLAIGAWLMLQGDRYAKDPSILLMLPRLYFEWILGMYVADCFLQNRRALPGPWWTGWVFAAYAVLAAGRGWWELGVIPAISLATAYWIEQIIHHRRPAHRLEQWLMPLGVVSYSLYLWHQPIVNQIVRHVLDSPRGLAAVGSGGLVATGFALSILAAVIVAVGSYQLFELPSIEYVKRRSKARPPGNPSDSACPPTAGRDLRVDRPHGVQTPTVKEAAVPAK